MVTRNSAFNIFEILWKRCKIWNRRVPCWALLPFYSSLLIVRRTCKKWRDSGSNKNELRCSLPKFRWKWIYASSSSLHTIFRRDCTRGCCMAWLRDCWRWRFLCCWNTTLSHKASFPEQNLSYWSQKGCFKYASNVLRFAAIVQYSLFFYFKEELGSCDQKQTRRARSIKRWHLCVCVWIVYRGVYACCVAQVWDGQVVCCSCTQSLELKIVQSGQTNRNSGK